MILLMLGFCIFTAGSYGLVFTLKVCVAKTTTVMNNTRLRAHNSCAQQTDALRIGHAQHHAANARARLPDTHARLVTERLAPCHTHSSCTQ